MLTALDVLLLVVPSEELLDVLRYVRDRGQLGLWSRVWRKAEVDERMGCLLWTGALSQKRRGKRPVVQMGGRGTPVVIVARLVCEWFHGPPSTPLHEAGHTCPSGECAVCVHPQHLAWQTREENEAQKRTYGTGIARVQDNKEQLT